MQKAYCDLVRTGMSKAASSAEELHISQDRPYIINISVNAVENEDPSCLES